MGKWDTHFKELSKKNVEYTKRWAAAHPDRIRAYRSTPRFKAKRFLRNNPDCTSTLEVVTSIYEKGINALTGKKGTTGKRADDLCLDHIHGGPAIGLIPHWLNSILWSAMHDPAARQYIINRLTGGMP